ncbi:MAG: hypothetical protein AABX47_04810 [Nanoarchaeota archaeon]
MPLETFLKYEGIDPSTSALFIDANSLHQAHPSEVGYLRLHITSGVREEFRQWEVYQSHDQTQNQFSEALMKACLEETTRKLFTNRIYQNAMRFDISLAVVKEIEKYGLIVNDRKEIDPLVAAAARFNAKRLAAEAARKYLPVWEPTQNKVWRHKQIDVAVGYADLKYSRRIAKQGLDSNSGYSFTRIARIKNISRHVGYLFDSFCEDPKKAGKNVDANLVENDVDQRLLTTARVFNNRRDRKESRMKVIISEDIDLIEMMADLSFMSPNLLRNVRIVRPRRRN